MDTTNGEIISHVRVSDVGLATGLLKIRYSDLKRIGYGVRKIALVPVWYESASVVRVVKSDLPWYSYFNISSPSLLQIHRFNEREFLVYIGSWRNVSLWDKANLGEYADEDVNDIQSNINELKTLSISELPQELLNNLVNELNPPDSLAHNIMDVIYDVTNSIKIYVWDVLRELITQLSIELIKLITLALLPDPTGGLVSSLINYVVSRIRGTLKQPSFDEYIIEKFFVNIVNLTARYLLTSILKQIVTNVLFNQLKQIAESIGSVLKQVETTVNNYLNAMYNLLELANYSHYYPVIFSRIEVYDAKTFNIVSWRGILSDKILLPLDKLTISSTGELGVIIFVKPYYVQETLLNTLGELFNIDLLKQFKGQFMVHGMLLAVASWAYYIGNISSIKILEENLYQALCRASSDYFKVVVNITEWITIYGLGNDIAYPEVYYIPATTI